MNASGKVCQLQTCAVELMKYDCPLQTQQLQPFLANCLGRPSEAVGAKARHQRLLAGDGVRPDNLSLDDGLLGSSQHSLKAPPLVVFKGF